MTLTTIMMGATTRIWYFTATPTTSAAMLKVKSRSRLVFNHLKKNSMDRQKKKSSMVSIIAILDSQTIPGITANSTPDTKAVFSPYISLAIL